MIPIRYDSLASVDLKVSVLRTKMKTDQKTTKGVYCKTMCGWGYPEASVANLFFPWELVKKQGAVI